MSVCVSCESGLEVGDKFCTRCGAPQPEQGPAIAVAAANGVAAPPSPSPKRTASAPQVHFDGPAEQNPTYIGNRMAFDREGVESFDFQLGGSSIKFLVGSLVAAWVTTVVAAFLLAIPGFVLAQVLPDKLVLFLAVCGLVAIFVLVLVGRLRTVVQVPVSEWRFVLDGQAAAADGALDRVVQALRDGGTPIESHQAYRTAEGRTYLEVVRKPFVAYVSCFAYGADLYVGWTLWWSSNRLAELRRGSKPGLFNVLRAFLQPSVPPSLQLTMRSDEGKALREVIHNATRRAVEATADEQAVEPLVLGRELTVTERPDLRL